MKAPTNIGGDPISLVGFHEALKVAQGKVDGNAERTEAAHYAGVVTLQDKRVVDVCVFVRVRDEEQDT